MTKGRPSATMDSTSWQRNIRMMHYISEFLDLDTSKFAHVADFIALIEAIREGLLRIDEDFLVQDHYLNLLFLSKLKENAEWNDWALDMLRDQRINATNGVDPMPFSELASLAIEHEKKMLARKRKQQQQQQQHRTVTFTEAPTGLTQEEINAFVIEQMSQRRRRQPNTSEGQPLRAPVKGHAKTPSQEEINDFVVHQMREEQKHKTRNRSHSLPAAAAAASVRDGESVRRNEREHDATTTTTNTTTVHNKPADRAARCAFCGETYHSAKNCWRRWRVAVEMPKGNFVPKRVEFRSEIPGQPPVYHTGFTLV